MNRKFTDICRVGMLKRSGDEWITYSKTFTLTETPIVATIKLNAEGVCGIFVNGEFVEAHKGRLPNRITYLEITSKLHVGENKVELLLGSHFYQKSADTIYKRRGSWFSCVAAEIEITYNSKKMVVCTNKDWDYTCDQGEGKAEVLSEITALEYERFWEHAALWQEKSTKMPVPEKVFSVVSEEYMKYLKKEELKYAFPDVMEQDDMHVLYDFGRLQVGYTILEYEAECNTEIEILYDYTESIADFQKESSVSFIVQRMKVTIPLKKGRHTTTVIRRRACRYMQVQWDFAENVQIHECKIHLSMKPPKQKGWFRCDDEVLNDCWEVGKYTLQVNKHQEYESCPRHEAKFFSGDGILTALVDYYAFGDNTLADASLAISELPECTGIRHDVYERNVELWDYPAWRILMVYNQYLYYADKEFLYHYYEETVMSLLWMINKAGLNNLIYQHPVFYDGNSADSGSVEYTCSYDRIGYKIYLNALFYKSLLCMSELGECIGDDRCQEWKQLAESVRLAINDKLWSENMKCYIDLQYPESVPQDGNALAVLFGVADPEKAKLVLDTLKASNWSSCGSSILSMELSHTRGGKKVVSPLMCTYEAEARFLQGDTQNALELIRRCWGTMLAKGAGTFWEFEPNNETERWRAPTHGWSAGCTYLLSAYVLGVRPSSYGYEKMFYEPCMDLNHYEGVVPTAKGYVAVKCQTVNGKKKITLVIPEGMDTEIAVPEECEVDIQKY